MIYQKTFRTDCISKHTKINRGERTKYLVSNNHPAIVDRDLFNAVQAELARRSSKRRTSDKTLTSLGKYSGKYALSELLICAECGSPYKRKTWTKGDEKRIFGVASAELSTELNIAHIQKVLKKTNFMLQYAGH